MAGAISKILGWNGIFQYIVQCDVCSMHQRHGLGVTLNKLYCKGFYACIFVQREPSIGIVIV